MFNVITGFLSPNVGKIIYGEQNITRKSPVTISSIGVARTFQISRVFPKLTVEENLKVAMRRNTPADKLTEIIDQFDLADIKSTPAAKVSFGRKKMVELARNLIADPKLLLLVEPTAGLEPALIDVMINQIRNVQKRGKGIIIIEHNMNLIMSLAEQIFVLHNGRKIAEGTPQEISDNQTVIDAYLGAR